MQRPPVQRNTSSSTVFSKRFTLGRRQCVVVHGPSPV
jgi:hypothetical protein